MANNSTIKLDFPKYLETLPTVADLRAYPIGKVKAQESIQLTGRNAFNDGLGAFYVWDPFNTNSDDDSTIVRPLGQSGAGRWVKTNFSSPGQVVNSLGSATDLAPSQAAVAGAVSSNIGVKRSLKSKADDLVSVKDFGAKADGVTDDTPAFVAAFAAANRIYAPAGTYLITGNGFSMTSGQALYGDVGCEVGTRYSITGTILKLAPTATRAIFVTKGTGSIADGPTIEGINFNGQNNDYAIYCDTFRQGQMRRLRFDNFKTCIYSDTDNWLNTYEDIKAFDFDKFFHSNSGGEDSTFKGVIVRGYRANSVGVLINYYSQTMYFVGCDISECGVHYQAPISLGNHTVKFTSCYFEQSAVGTGGMVNLSTGTGSSIIATFDNCRFFDKSNNTLPNSTAFRTSTSGSGGIEIIANGNVFSAMDYLVHDVTGNSLENIEGRGNLINNTPGTVVFNGVRNGARRLKFVGLANLKNLASIGGSYFTNFTFTTGNTFSVDLTEAGVSGTGILQVDITTAGYPGAIASYRYQPKGFFGNAMVLEVLDNTSAFTATVSGETLNLTCSTDNTNAQISITKIA